jgi:hypothetical protein
MERGYSVRHERDTSMSGPILLQLFPTADQLLQASEIERERALLDHVAAVCADPARRMATREGVATELYGRGGYDYHVDKRNNVQRVVSRAWKALEDAGLIEEPDPDNGRNGYRVVSEKGRTAITEIDFGAAKIRGVFTREMFHTSLPDAAWNAFRAGDYDTAVFEAFKAVEIAVYKKGKYAGNEHGVPLMMMAFNPTNGPLRSADASHAEARRNLFAGALGELRNPKAHRGPRITDPLIAIEEMMTAGALLRIVESA